MKTIFERTKEEQNIIKKAYDFEISAIKRNSSAKNPYFKRIKKMGLLEELNIAVELAFYRY